MPCQVCPRPTNHKLNVFGEFRSTTEKIRLQPAVTMLVRPERQRNRREIVHHWHRISILREIDRSNKKLASLASLHPNMRELLCHIHRKFLLFFLPARGAQNPPELPLVRAKRADHAALSAVALDPQHSKQCPPAAQRTHTRRCQNRRHGSPSRDIRSV